MERRDEVWKGEALVRTFLRDVRGGIPFGAEQIEIMLRVVGSGVATVRRFADLGCGNGVLARAMLARWPKARATLVDFSAPMLAAAEQDLSAHPSAPRFVLADLADARWVDAVAAAAPFDAVVSAYAIHHLPDARKRSLYAEIHALLAPGGLFVNVEHVASSTPWVEALSDDLIVDSLHAFHGARGAARTRADVAAEFVHRPDKAANILAPVEDQCTWLRACGFADVDCYFKVFEMAVFGGRRLSQRPARVPASPNRARADGAHRRRRPGSPSSRRG